MACSEAVKGVVVVEVEGVVRAVVRVVGEKVEVNSVALMGVAAMVAELAVAVVATVGSVEAGTLAADAVAVAVVEVAVVATEDQAAGARGREAAAGDPVEAMMEVTTEAATEAATEVATEAATEAATESSPLPNGWASPSSKTQLRAGARERSLGGGGWGWHFQRTTHAPTTREYRGERGPRRVNVHSKKTNRHKFRRRRSIVPLCRTVMCVGLSVVSGGGGHFQRTSRRKLGASRPLRRARQLNMMSLQLAFIALSSRPTHAPLTSRHFPTRARATFLMSEDDLGARAAWLAKQQNPLGGQNVHNKQRPAGGQNVRKPGSQASAGHNVRRPKRAQASTGAAAANRDLLEEIKRRAAAAAPGSMDGPPPWMDGPPPWMDGPPPGRGGPPPGMGRPPPGAMEFGNGGPVPGSGFGSLAHPFDGYGAESPLPGGEGEYEAFRARGGAAGAGRAFVRPPIDKGRQAQSPGLQNNFYEVPPSEFRKAYSAARAPAPGAPYGARSPAQPSDGYGAEPPPPGMGGPPPEMGGPPEFDGGAAQGMGGAQLGGPVQASAAQDDGLQARVQQLERSRERSEERSNERILQLERSNERLQLALSGVREREEAARRQVAELTAREEALSQRLAAVEARLAGRGSRWAVDAGTASSAVGEAPAAGMTVADSSRMSLPEKVDMIQERLGLAPGGESLVAAVMEASEVADVPIEGAPLVVQVDRLMVKLFGQSTGWGVRG